MRQWQWVNIKCLAPSHYLNRQLGLLPIGFLGTNLSEIRIGIISFPFNKMHLKLSSAKMTAIMSRGSWVNPDVDITNTRCWYWDGAQCIIVQRNGRTLYDKDGGSLMSAGTNTSNDRQRTYFIINPNTCPVHIGHRYYVIIVLADTPATNGSTIANM